MPSDSLMHGFWICTITEQKSIDYGAKVQRIVRGSSSVGTMPSLPETRPRPGYVPDSSPAALFSTGECLVYSVRVSPSLL
jgi:hypothetical protein